MAREVDETLLKFEHYMNPALARVFRFMGLDTVEDHAQGAVITDVYGAQYLDLAGGYGVFIHGYQHPRIVAAAREQLERMALSSRVLPSRPAADLAELLAEVTPGDLTYSFFCNSGAEAVEAALKFARLATGRQKIIATHGAFHGKTMGALSVTGREMFRAPFAPLVPGIVHVPYGDLDAVRPMLDDETAAMIVEPIQGEGGIIVPPDAYLPGLRALCDQHGALLIDDEVQTGMGRTGKLFAIEHSGVVPDLMCLAKALGGGVMPIGAVVGRPSAWRFFEQQPLIHTSTFGGGPLACRVAMEAIRVALEEDLPAQAEVKGRRFKEGLDRLQASYPAVIREVRGRGLMLGLELMHEGLGGALMSELMSRHVLAVYTLNNPTVIRIIPPLVITEQQIAHALDALHASMAVVDAMAPDLVE